VETTFEDALRGLHATGASHSAYEIVNALARHGREEGELLQRYQRFGEEPESPPWVGYLVRLIVEDEQRHHRLLEELANTIAWGSLKGSPERVVPTFSRRGDQALVSESRALLAHELEDRKQLRRMRRRIREYGDVALWELLIDLMLSDTEKHIHIFRFILRNQTGRGRLGRTFRRHSLV
jgi:hypothetical protein